MARRADVRLWRGIQSLISSDLKSRNIISSKSAVSRLISQVNSSSSSSSFAYVPLLASVNCQSYTYLASASQCMQSGSWDPSERGHFSPLLCFTLETSTKSLGEVGDPSGSSVSQRSSLSPNSPCSLSRISGKFCSNYLLGLGLEAPKALFRPVHSVPLRLNSELGRVNVISRRHQHVSTAEDDKAPAAATVQDGLTLTESCIRRIHEIKKEDGPAGENKMLRLSVEGGGCSGFLYSFALDDKLNSDDKVFEREGAKVVVDDVSYSFVKGSTVDFTEELIRAAFSVTVNPNASSACGCGSSFTAK